MLQNSYHSLQQSDNLEDDQDDDDFQSILDISQIHQNIQFTQNRPTAYVKINRILPHYQTIQEHQLTKSYSEKYFDRPLHKEHVICRSQFIEYTPRSEHSETNSRSSLKSPLLQGSFEIPAYQLPMLRKQKNNYNRLEVLLQRSRPQRSQEVPVCSFDTSAALIRLMIRKRFLRYFINIYIWITIVLRFAYVALIIYYAIDQKIIKSNFYYALFGTLFAIRLLYWLIIYKLLRIGSSTKDKKIKIVYETYISWFEEINNKIKNLERQIDNMQVRTIDDQHELNKSTKEIRRLNKWLILLKTYVILLPPELSFIALKKQSNGFFQVQNYIIKSLEIFFFTPPFVYFLSNSLDLEIKYEDWFTIKPFKVYSLCSWVLLIDFSVFWLLVMFLVIYNNRRKQVLQQ